MLPDIVFMMWGRWNFGSSSLVTLYGVAVWLNKLEKGKFKRGCVKALFVFTKWNFEQLLFY